jgi:ribonuclease HI
LFAVYPSKFKLQCRKVLFDHLAICFKAYNPAHNLVISGFNAVMTDSSANPLPVDTSVEDLPREVRVAQLRNLVETLYMADEIASKGYLISSSELADLMDVNASAVTSRGDNWVWRNWVVSRVRREGNQILWQLERVD